MKEINHLRKEINLIDKGNEKLENEKIRKNIITQGLIMDTGNSNLLKEAKGKL